MASIQRRKVADGAAGERAKKEVHFKVDLIFIVGKFFNPNSNPNPNLDVISY